jgi:large subunit ribosomal protein L30
MLKVTQVKSSSGQNKNQVQTLIGLGLNKINRTSVLNDTPSIRGMISKVQHLIKVEANETK